MLTYAKIYNKDIPAETLTNDWLVEDQITWVREDLEWGMTFKRKVSAAAEIMMMQYTPWLWRFVNICRYRKSNIDVIDFDLDEILSED